MRFLQMVKFLFLNGLIIPALLCLAACSGGPGANDIKAAVQAGTDAMIGRGTAIIEEVTDVSCKEAQGKPGYVCSFTATVMNHMTNSHGAQAMEARFVQSGANWTIMNSL